jgi:hypothetical protein
MANEPEGNQVRIRTRFGIAAVTAGVALAVVAVPVSAATGQLILYGPRPTLINNPSAGCHRTLEFSQVTNNTNAYVTVHTDANCADFGLVVSPGSTMPVGSRNSVRVHS